MINNPQKNKSAKCEGKIKDHNKQTTYCTHSQSVSVDGNLLHQISTLDANCGTIKF